MDWRYQKEVTIDLGEVKLKGELIIPDEACSVIVFSHGSGSSRSSPRNQMVARFLHTKGFATLLFDLLTVEEDRDYSNRFNIELLTQRLAATTEWLRGQNAARDCAIGYFGASTGAASALNAAALLKNIGAVVSRGGRPDLAEDLALKKLRSPSLLIVGSLDHDVLALNRKAFEMIHCDKCLEIVWGASHLFEEPGTMEKVCNLAAGWFEKYLQPVKV